MTNTWKPTKIQAKHIAVNAALIKAGWDQANSRAGVANSIFDGKALRYVPLR